MEPSRPRLREIFWSFAKMGAVLIGGGYALLPLLEREVVGRRAWAKAEEMIDLYALAQLLPGIIAVNASMLVGNRLRGLAGTLAAAYGALRDTSLFARLLGGLQGAVAGMILGLGFDMARRTAKTARHGALAALAALAALLLNPPFGWFLLAALALGLAAHLRAVRRAAA